MNSDKTIDVGSTLGSYRLINRLGAGGAGAIFKASHIETGELVAIKILRPGAEVNEDIHARFIREISVAQKLSDPHITAYRDCGVEDGVLFFTMEFVPWGSMADVLRSRGVLPWREACECGVQISKGLQHLHESEIVHRDLKPANIFLSDDGRLKLGDFGLARDFAEHRLTVDGLTVGTVKYIAPEQARGEADIDARADLYALGCNLFEYMVGRTPFDNPSTSAPVDLMEMMRRHIEDPPAKVIDLVPTCPAALSELIDRLMAKDRDDRPNSTADVANALQRILQNPEAPLDTSALPTTSSESVADPETDETTEQTEQRHLTERLRSGTGSAAEPSTRTLVTILLIVIAVIAVVVVLGSSRS